MSFHIKYSHPLLDNSVYPYLKRSDLLIVLSDLLHEDWITEYQFEIVNMVYTYNLHIRGHQMLHCPGQKLEITMEPFLDKPMVRF